MVGSVRRRFNQWTKPKRRQGLTTSRAGVIVGQSKPPSVSFPLDLGSFHFLCHNYRLDPRTNQENMHHHLPNQLSLLPMEEGVGNTDGQGLPPRLLRFPIQLHSELGAGNHHRPTMLQPLRCSERCNSSRHGVVCIAYCAIADGRHNFDPTRRETPCPRPCFLFLHPSPQMATWLKPSHLHL